MMKCVQTYNSSSCVRYQISIEGFFYNNCHYRLGIVDTGTDGGQKGILANDYLMRRCCRGSMVSYPFATVSAFAAS
jgi:hypothetical protein